MDRNLKPLGELKDIPASETVDSLKKLLIKNIDAVKKRKIGIERIRLTINDSRGVALADNRKTINDYSKDTVVTLVFKDLGPQISWTTVFLVEYFGPILITAVLAFF